MAVQPPPDTSAGARPSPLKANAVGVDDASVVTCNTPAPEPCADGLKDTVNVHWAAGNSTNGVAWQVLFCSTYGPVTARDWTVNAWVPLFVNVMSSGSD